MKTLVTLLLAFGLTLIARALPIQVDPAGSPFTGTYAVEWESAGNFESWTTSQTATATVSAGQLTATSSGTDPQVILSNFANGPDLDLGFNDYVELRIQVPASYLGDIQIFYGTTGTTGFNAARVLTIPAATIPKDGAFHTYRIDVGPEPWWRGTLRDLRIDPVSTSGQAFAIDYLRVGDLPGDVYLANTTDQPVTAYELSSKHFRFIWNAARATTNGINTTIARGTLRNAEEAWQTYVKLLGYREPAESMNLAARNGNKYKVNFLCTFDGFWMGGSPTSFGYFNIEPGGLQVDPPSWVIPHELMHVFQMHNDGGHMPGEWWETHANYGRERWLYHYANLYPNESNIEAQAVRDSHLMMSSGRNYYLTWPFFLYLDENPDALPDLYDGIVAKMWQETQANEFPTTTLDRLTPATSLKDIVGYYARRGATFDYARQSAINSKLNTQDATRNARHIFTDLVQRPDAPGWWRVPMHKAPAQGAYAIHELIPTGSGAGRMVTVNLRGLADTARGADWRASFIAVNDSGVERYTPLWNSGGSSITLAANENKLYLSVAGTPDLFYYGGHDESVYPFRSHPSRSRFHYELQVTGATPRERTNGATTGLVQHSNGGGWKASTATVDATAFIGPNARVLGTAKIRNNARVEDFAVVQDSAQVLDNAIVSGHAWVRSNAIVRDHGRVRDWAIVDGGTVSANARVLEHATSAATLTDTAAAKGSANAFGGTLSGNAIVDADYSFDKSLSNGVTIGHLPYVGIPDSFTRATPAGLHAAYDFATAHDSRILDRYGVTEGYAIGSPAWIAADAKRKGYLQFNGTDQYAVLERSVADTRAFTFTAWVKPLGGNANQAVLWLGATPARRLCFTPDDGTGHAKFSIASGGVDQTLTAPTALIPAIWSHVAITLDGTTGTLYVNGTAVASAPISIVPDQLLAANTASAAQHNYLARAEGSAMPMFRGALDDAQFFTTALSAADIAALQPATTVSSSGALLVDLRATDATAGTATWTNTGTLGGSFTSTGTPAKLANVLSSGVPGVQFNGSNQAYTGPVSTADIDGAGDRSIEVWAWNPSLTDEETTVSWGHRGSVLQAMAFNFGNNTNWGAATHWGDDAGWGAAPPAAGSWRHLVYTYSANVVRLYIDGVPANTKTLGGPLNTFAGEPINLACQRDSANGTRSKWFSGYLNTVRIHGGVLTAGQIAANASLGPAGAPLNAAPSVSGLSSQTIYPGSSLSLPFTVADPDTPATALTVTATSSNGTLVPAANLSITGTGSARTLQITPAPGLSGSSAISITVADGALATTAAFNLTVNLTPAEWRMLYFQTTENTGNAADDADPDLDGKTNAQEYLAGTHPTVADFTVDVSITSPAADPVTIATTSHTLRLAAAITQSGPGTPTLAWSMLAGPGSVTFTADSATFPAPGTYVLQATATLASASDTATRTVLVAPPSELTFRQGENGYAHAATMVRGDSPTWNAGARDQFLAGRNSSAALFRSLLSFDLSAVPDAWEVQQASLELWTAGEPGTAAGTLPSVELRTLTTAFTEGTGISAAAASAETTSGANWNRRTASIENLPWDNPGGHGGTTVLSTLTNAATAPLNEARTFASTTAFVTAAREAVVSNALHLVIRTPDSFETGATNAFTRFHSDDSATTAMRPRLRLTGSGLNPSPTIDPGIAPSAVTGDAVPLQASVSSQLSCAWSVLIGPGSVTFGNSTLPATSAAFSKPGAYLLKLSASNASGETSRTLAVNVAPNPAYLADWRELNWPGINDPAITGPGSDPDKDGLVNLMEWALHLDPKQTSVFVPVLARNGLSLEFTYIRRKTAPGAATWQAEWSDTLGGDWSPAGITEAPAVGLTTETESVTLTLPAGSAGRRFVRLKLAAP